MTHPAAAADRSFAWTPDPASGITARWVQAGDTRFEVAECLPTDAPAGADADVAAPRRLALCLHGFPELNISWRHQMPMLAARGWRVWAPDLRGYGGSDRPSGIDAYRADVLAGDVAALISAAEADAGGPLEVMLVAHDWGALIAWHFAIKFPDRLARLIIMNVPHPTCSQREIRRWHQLRKSWYIFFFQLPWLPEWVMTRDGASAVAGAFTDTAAIKANFPAEVLQVYRDAALRPGAMTAMLNFYRAMVRRRDMFDIGDGVVHVPTLIVWGENDVAIDIRCLDGTGDYVPDLTIVRLPGISHWVQQDAPDAVNAAMAQWLGARGG